MKGTLHKTSRGWIVKQVLGEGPHAKLINQYPLHSDDIPAQNEDHFWLEGKEVEFEITDFSQTCKECGEIVERGRSCSKGCFMKPGNYVPTTYLERAKLIKNNPTTTKPGFVEKRVEQMIHIAAKEYSNGAWNERESYDAFVAGANCIINEFNIKL